MERQRNQQSGQQDREAGRPPDESAGRVDAGRPVVASSTVGGEEAADSPARPVPAEHRPANLRPGWNLPQPEHLPHPTYWPVVMALGITLLAWGVIASWAMSLVGLVLFGISLAGWLGDLHHAE